MNILKRIWQSIATRFIPQLLAVSLKKEKRFKIQIINLMVSILICWILTNNWFISIVSSIIVSIFFIVCGYFIRVYINNRKIIKIFSNDYDIKICEINDDTIIDLIVVLEDINQKKILIKNIECELRILFSDGYKNNIIPNIELRNKQQPQYIDFSIDGEILEFQIKFKTEELKKIGLVWYKLICGIVITTSKNQRKLIHVDLSDKLLKILQNENNIPNLDNLKHFIDLKHISNILNKASETNKDEIIEKSIINNPKLLEYCDDEDYSFGGDQYELKDDGKFYDRNGNELTE